MPTSRFMCLGCGKYWSSGERPLIRCPYCSDKYFTDNIREDVPPAIGNVRIDFGCGHCMSTDIGAEVKYCPACLNEDVRFNYGGEKLTLEDWQISVLERLGL